MNELEAYENNIRANELIEAMQAFIEGKNILAYLSTRLEELGFVAPIPSIFLREAEV